MTSTIWPPRWTRLQGLRNKPHFLDPGETLQSPLDLLVGSGGKWPLTNKVEASMTRLRTPEAAKYADRPEATFRWWRHIGYGPRSYKIGRAVFYDVADLDEWLGQQKAATAVGGLR